MGLFCSGIRPQRRTNAAREKLQRFGVASNTAPDVWPGFYFFLSTVVLPGGFRPERSGRFCVTDSKLWRSRGDDIVSLADAAV